MLRISLADMKLLWRRRLGLLSADCGCSIAGHDHVDLDLLLSDRIRGWYASLLRTAPAELLPVRDLSAEIISATLTSSNSLLIELPPAGIRPVSVWLSDWELPELTFHAPDSYIGQLQRHPCTQASYRMPVAVYSPGQLILYGLKPAATDVQPADPAVRIRSLRMIAPPDDLSTLILDESLLSSIPTSL